jgi:hypothetical protein
VSYCKPLPPGKNPFAVNKYYIALHLSGRTEEIHERPQSLILVSNPRYPEYKVGVPTPNRSKQR